MEGKLRAREDREGEGHPAGRAGQPCPAPGLRANLPWELLRKELMGPMSLLSKEA